MKKIKFGILSTAKIGREQVIPAIQKSQLCSVEAIASRNIEMAKTYASQLNIPKYYGSYEELLADESIDAVYNPTPNHLHVPWSIKTLEAGKHILCEKPLGLDADEVQSLIDINNKYPSLIAMEAFMYRFHPQWKKAKALVDEGAIGSLRSIHTFFSYYNDDPNNVRYQEGMGGGGLYDIGCYGISTARFITSKEPISVSGVLYNHPEYKIDTLAAATLNFDTVVAQFICTTQSTPYQKVQIVGTKGRIEVEIPFNPPNDIPTKIYLYTENQLLGKEFVFPIADQYTIQVDAFAQAIINKEQAPTPLSDALANMKIIDEIFKNASCHTI